MQQPTFIVQPDELSPRERMIADLALKLSTNMAQAEATIEETKLERLRKNDLCEEEIQEVVKAAALFNYWSQQNNTVAPPAVRSTEQPTLFDPIPYFFEGTH